MKMYINVTNPFPNYFKNDGQKMPKNYPKIFRMFKTDLKFF